MFWPRLESFSAFSLRRLLCLVILHIFALPAALSCAVLHCWGGEKEKQAGTGECSHFPVSFQRVTKTVTSLLPACQAEPPASCCTQGESGCALHTGSSQSHISAFLLGVCSPSCCLGWPWAELEMGSPSQVCTGERFLCLCSRLTWEQLHGMKAVMGNAWSHGL